MPSADLLEEGRWYSIFYVAEHVQLTYHLVRLPDQRLLAQAMVKWGAVIAHPQDSETVKIKPEFWEICNRELAATDAILRLGGTINEDG